MEFARLQLDGFKCYQKTDVEFVPGTTVIHGVNGSGKSSLLEACFFALYGADSLPTGTTLEDIITKGEDEAELELWFNHQGYQYRIHRSLRITDTQVLHDAVMETPDGERTGVKTVDEAIRSKLRMDAESFLNCAYIRQGDITRLLTATPEERQTIIDNLLQLGKLESYRERMDQARLGVKHVKDKFETRLEGLKEEITELESESLEDRLASVTASLDAVEEKLDAKIERREKLRSELSTIEEELSQFEERESELTEVREEIEKIQAKLEETSERLTELNEKVSETEEVLSDHRRVARAEIEDIDLEITIPGDYEPDSFVDPTESLETELEDSKSIQESLREEIEEIRSEVQETINEKQRLLEQVENLEERAANAEDRADQRRKEATEYQQKLHSKKQDIEELEETINEYKQEFIEDRPRDSLEFGEAATYLEEINERLEDTRTREQELKSKQKALEDRIEHAENLLQKGKCPECGQDVSGSPEVASLEEDQEELSDVVETLAEVTAEKEELLADKGTVEDLFELEKEVSEMRNEIESNKEIVDDYKTQIEKNVEKSKEIEEEAAEKRKLAASKESAIQELKEENEIRREELKQKQGELERFEERIERIQDLLTRVSTLQSLAETYQGLISQIADVESLLEQHEANLADLEETKEELENVLDPARLSDLREKQESLTAEVEALEATIDELKERQKELTEEIGEINTKKNRLGEKEKAVERVEEKVTAISTLLQECIDLRDMYGQLRTELRKQNVTRLEVLLNDIFDLVYESDAYARIELSESYELVVHEKVGEELSPTELSGGEKALFNLSLRCAIYQLLVEGTGNAALPPLILDEPTVHLDSEHINRISELVGRMRDLGVSQTIVVSHAPEIVDGADERMEVIQNPGTNRSRVNTESTDLLSDIELQ